MLKYTLYWDDIEESERNEDLVKEKLGSIDKYLVDVKTELKSLEVLMSTGARWGYKVKLNLKIPGRNFFAQAKDRGLVLALVESRDRVITQVKDYLEKLKDH